MIRGNKALEESTGAPLVVQRLRPHGPSARGPGWTPGQGTRSHGPQLQLRPGTAKQVNIDI